MKPTKNIVMLDTLTFGEDISTSQFDALGSVTRYATTNKAQTKERIKNAHVIITNKVVIDEALMQASPNLELICVAATGMNNIDLEAAKMRNIAVKNVAGYSTQSVVQLTFSMLFYLYGRMRYYDEYVKSGAYSKGEIFTHIGSGFSEIDGKRWGIIGMGTIGQAVAKIATSFGCEVVYTSTSGKNTDQPYEHVALTQLLKTCDIISIHAPLNKQTKDLIDANNITLLKENGVLLNLGRGGIINEEALSDALEHMNIFVGLDVLSTEPLAATHPLMQHKSDRLLITPHIAWTSKEARIRLLDSVYHHIKEQYI